MDNYQQENPINDENQTIEAKETSHPFNVQNLATLNGRMGRLDFAILSFALFFLTLLIQKILGINPFLVGASALTESEIIDKDSINLGLMTSMVGLFAFTFLTVKRLHDINYSGWLSLIFILPLLPLGFISGLLVLVGFILRLILLFAKGEPTKNKFGNIPPGNHRSKLFLLIGLLIAIFFTYSSLYSEAKPILEPIIQELIQQIEQQ